MTKHVRGEIENMKEDNSIQKVQADLERTNRTRNKKYCLKIRK